MKSAAIFFDKVLTFEPESRSWSCLLSLAQEWCGHSGVGANGKVYVEAGSSKSGDSFRFGVLAVDPNTRTSSEADHYSGRRFQFHAASELVEVGDSAFLAVVGGFREGDSPTERLQLFGLSDGSWVSRSDMPRASFGHDCFSFESTTMYVLGGSCGLGNHCRAYSAEEDVWREHCEIVRPCMHSEVEVIRQEAYALSVDSVLSSFSDFSDSWSVLSSPPSKTVKAGSGLSLLDEILFVVACEESREASFFYSVLSDSWVVAGMEPFLGDLPRHGHTLDWAKE